IVVEAFLPCRGRFHVAFVGETVLLLAGDAPPLGHELRALSHRQAGAWLDHARPPWLEVTLPQTEPGLHSVAERAAAIAFQQKRLVGLRIDDRRIADGVDASGDASVDLAERDLVADQDGRLEARAAGALDVEPGRLG